MNLDNIEQEQQVLEPWLSVIGMITVFWSPVERYIDQCVSMLYEAGKCKKKPLTLGHKLNYVQPELTKLGFDPEDIESLVRLTKNTVQIRDICVHGVIDSFDCNELKIGKIQGKAEKHTIEMFTLTSQRLHLSATNLMRLNKYWHNISTELSKRLNHS
ncbi:hypothetical protein [Vibrio parahaemolyticus]|uniref:hypothetical protein n=1 Tax=Vibrio parahaemolyticus TaxID=670 RepID=UPI0011241BEE|nr:hypothetical protein [Vibrio parahaemolyticus]TOE80718.1 hypothetical protein CGJ34_23510 [Vibrio parahaemolyticus]HAS6906025.1 hypothetical protein [Vibrio parahaemolyticus]